MDAVASDAERSAVDAAIGTMSDRRVGQVAHGGPRRAAGRRTHLLPALHALQDEAGWISPGGLTYVCDRLDVPPAEAFGVATFYSLIATEERPRQVAHVCDDIVCLGAGAGEVLASLDDDTEVHRSPCLGRCDQAPAVFVQNAGAANIVVAPADTGRVRLVLDPQPGTTPVTSAPMPVQAGDASTRLLRGVGTGPPASFDAYRARGGCSALERALRIGREAVLAEVDASGLRGRGGAAFPADVKWRAVAAATEATRYVICNADESEPGTFKDRVLLEHDPFAVIEALVIAGFAVAAAQGFIYLRGEYPEAERVLDAALTEARLAGMLGESVLRSEFAFDIEVRRGAGAYVCGEETALFNSIEGLRGEPRQKPPFPTEAGLFGKPTLINNVETLANIPWILQEGGAAFAERGTEDSSGSKLFSVSGAVAVPGVYEVEFGATLGDVLDLAGGASDDLAAVLVGGAAGAFVGPDRRDIVMTFAGTRDAGIPLGSGAIVAFDASTDFTAVVARIAQFFADESCGQCVPCRVGTVRQVEALERLSSGADTTQTLGDLDVVLRDASICGLGQFASNAVQSALRLGLIGAGP